MSLAIQLYFTQQDVATTGADKDDTEACNRSNRISLVSDDEETNDMASNRKRKSPEIEEEEMLESLPRETRQTRSFMGPSSMASHAARNTTLPEVSSSSSTPASFFDRQMARANRPTASRSFADLFKSPEDILFQGGSFELAKQRAATLQLWLLLDLQDPTQFISQCLNRDLWSDATVKEFIRSNFIFLQYSVKSTQGLNYLSLYPVPASLDVGATCSDYQMPHIAILDPRTGERMKVWQKSLSVIDLLQELSDFMDAHTLASPLANSNPPKTCLNDFLPECIPEPSAPQYAPPDITRIQFRLPDGTRYIRRYLKTHLIRDLYSSLLYEFPATFKSGFICLYFQSTDLKSQLTLSLQQAGLLNAAVSVKAIQ
jgi:5-carboxymethyl-2-hydroxymuconate isomerase